jgi:5-methylcytosine-specific restriction endonuclease McrA
MQTFVRSYPKPSKKAKAPHPIGRSEAQKAASLRDGYHCLWCKHVRCVLNPLQEVHHLFGRGRSDTLKTCMGLCAGCHQRHHSLGSPTTQELVELMVRLYKYDYSDCAEFMKPIAID